MGRIKGITKRHYNIDSILKKKSKLYKSLREKYKYITLKKAFRMNDTMMRDAFLYPKSFINIKKLIILIELLPEFTVYEILTELASEYEYKWYELIDFSEEEILEILKKYE